MDAGMCFMPSLRQPASTATAAEHGRCARRLICFCLFTLGAVAIGLVLFDHQHCSISDPNITRVITVSVDGSMTTGLIVAENGDDHAGHNH